MCKWQNIILFYNMPLHYVRICSPLTNPIESILCNTGVDVLSGSVLFTSIINEINYLYN